jgi:hypothetical protein
MITVQKTQKHKIDDLKMAITEYIRNADRAVLNRDRAVLNRDRAVLNTDRAILNTVFENSLACQYVSGDWRGTWENVEHYPLKGET